MDIIFWSCAIILAYTFVGYPLILKVLTCRNSRTELPEFKDAELPALSIILCIYNGANQLKARIDNLKKSDYPQDKIHIIVISDGSTDHPATIVNALNYPNLTFIEYEQNKGKSNALAVALSQATTDLIAFADIRQTFCTQALKNMVKHFLIEGAHIGAVSGNLQIATDSDNNESDPGLYWKYEKWIREKESELHSMLGVTGAIYMAKRTLIPDIPLDILLDDMFIPMAIVDKGYKIKFEPLAIAFDTSSSSTAEEFHRKVRTLAGNFQLISKLPWLMSPLRNPLFFQFFSHKVLRLIMPYSLLAMLATSILLDGFIYQQIFAIQAIFYSYTILAYCMIKYDLKLPLASVFISFCSLNLAALIAGWKYLYLSTDQLWKKH